MTTRFSLNLPDGVMAEARVAAAEAQMSVDEWITALVSKGVEQRHGLRAMRDRAARADSVAALAVLDRVPDIEPDASDRIL